MGEMSVENDLYGILGVGADASTQQIRKAYHRLARRYHPDVAADQPGATARFQQITAAYQILSVPHKRMLYDQWRRAMQVQQQVEMPSSPHQPMDARGRRPKVDPEVLHRRAAHMRAQEAKATRQSNRIMLGVLLLLVLMVPLGIWGYRFMEHKAAQALLAEAQVFLQDGREEEAVSCLLFALEKDAELDAARVLLARHYLDGAPQVAYDHLVLVVGRASLPEEELMHARFLKGVAAKRLQRPQEALADIRMTIPPAYHPADPLVLRDRLQAEADVLLYALNRYREAAVGYETVLRIAPTPDALLGYAVVLFKLGEQQQAQSYFSRARAEGVSIPVWSFYYGFFLLQAVGDKEQACACWQTALAGGVSEAREPLAAYCPVNN